MAELLKKGLIDKGYKLYVDSPTNQQFVIINNTDMDKLKEIVEFAYWKAFDNFYK